MATITKKQIAQQNQYGGAPYGNQTSLPYKCVTNASGAYIDSDTTAAIGNGDKVRFGLIPAGFNLQDLLAIVSVAFTASVVLKLGFEYVDGVDSAAVPQDDDYFFAALAVNAVGRTRANNTAVAPVTLPKDAYLVGVFSGAANAKAAAVDLVLQGIATGAP